VLEVGYLPELRPQFVTTKGSDMRNSTLEEQNSFWLFHYNIRVMFSHFPANIIHATNLHYMYTVSIFLNCDWQFSKFKSIRRKVLEALGRENMHTLFCRKIE